jgi:hypothetical protein
MSSFSIALLVYGDLHSTRNAVSEEKYKDLAERFTAEGFTVTSVLYCDEAFEELRNSLLNYDAVLVWVNPVEQGRDRQLLDQLLREISLKGCFISAHPDTILKLGTKEVLYTTRHVSWGSDVRIYKNPHEFETTFLPLLKPGEKRIIKKYRGNGGEGVYKIQLENNIYTVTPANASSNGENFNAEELISFFSRSLEKDGMLIDQPWNENIKNGMVRCYVSGTKVSGFGYQEINALYESASSRDKYLTPSKRFYFTEKCGLFTDLKQLMENLWIPALCHLQEISQEDLPLIWDADFFINHPNAADEKYMLCEINASCVSPFPPSAIDYIVEELNQKLETKTALHQTILP